MFATTIANEEYTYKPELPKIFKKNNIEEKQKKSIISHNKKVFKEPK
tara:strand:- start:558 stop:698 length:141 start_codon:yes stop_codon:yes gene_type:complete